MLLAIKYVIFAVIATGVNIAGQDLSGRAYAGGFSLYVSMFVGTLAGLAVKYILDKKYIFYHTSKNLADDGRMFFIYTSMGIITTLLFWGTELGFEYAFHTKTMRYVGALLGLGVGYLVKYNLDKRFVFRESV